MEIRTESWTVITSESRDLLTDTCERDMEHTPRLKGELHFKATQNQ